MAANRIVLQWSTAGMPGGPLWMSDVFASDLVEALAMADAYGYVFRNDYRIVRTSDGETTVLAYRAFGDTEWTMVDEADEA